MGTKIQVTKTERSKLQNIGKILREARIERKKKLTMDRVAHACGVQRLAVHRREVGESAIDVIALKRHVRALGLSREEREEVLSRIFKHLV